MVNQKCSLFFFSVTQFSQFEGVIRTIVFSKEKLFFVVPKDEYKILKIIEKCKPEHQLEDLPGIHTWAMFFHEGRGKFYRAFILQTNKSDQHSRALFLYDTGEILYCQVKKENFFYVPDSVDHYSAFAIFAKIKIYNNPGEVRAPVKLEELQKRILKFTVLKNTKCNKERMQLNIENRCMVLRLDQNEVKRPEDDDNNSCDFGIYTSIRDIYGRQRASFTLDNLPKFDTGNIKAGSFILLYPSKFVVDEKSIYVNIANVFDYSAAKCFTKIVSKGFALKIWLNSSLILPFLQALDKCPKVNEMVISTAAGGNEYFDRAVVTKVHLDGENVEVSATKKFFVFIESHQNILQVFFIDLGCTQQLNINELFKFPVKCSTQPPQCVHLTATNLNQQNTKALESLPNVLMAQVE